jgi:gliding motility-associated-like protein
VASVNNICQNQLPHVVPITAPANATLTVSNSLGQSVSIPFTPSVTGVYLIKDSLNGCKTLTSVTVNINPSPTAPPSVTTSLQYCIGQSASALTATATPGNAMLNWLDANHNPISTPPNPMPTTNTPGTTTYYVYQSIGNCNSLPDSIKVTVVANPNPNFTTVPSTSISVGQSISFVPVQTTTVNAYSWNFEDPAAVNAGSTQQSPMYTYSGAGTYCPRLTVTNTATGCVESTTICLDVLTGISMVIPNVFSPNGDGINDVFSIKATGFTSLNCDIFDRWGLKLYSFTGENGYWDGSEKTGKAVDGTYFYVIQTTDIKGEDHKYNGFIQLIK